MNIKNGQHNHKVIVLTTFCYAHSYNLGAYINKDLHCMYYAQMYAALHAGIILQRPIARALYWAWLVKVLSGLLPACLTVCPGSACCPCCPLILGRLFFEPQKPRDNRNHDNTTLCQVCNRSLSMNMVRSRGGHQVL